MGYDRILINLIAYPVKVLGPGLRVGIWTQGCSIGCEGCMSLHTWDFDESRAMSISTVVDQAASYGSSSITISGGEPFQQKNLLLLLKALRSVGFTDIMLYSGYSEIYIMKHFHVCLSFIDVLICEAFIDGLESEAIYKGSDNQKMIVLNDKLISKYDSYMNLNKNKKLQKFDNTVIGIPYQKDIKALYEM